MTRQGGTFEEVLVGLVRERAKNIVQARSGWAAADDLDMLDVRHLVREAQKLHDAGKRPAARRVSDWRDEARQAMQPITSGVENIRTALAKDPTGQKFADVIAESAEAVVRNVDRLDRALAVLDAALPFIEAAVDFEAQLKQVATDVRDQCRHAAVCAPLHGERPEDTIDKVDLDFFVQRARGDET